MGDMLKFDLPKEQSSIIKVVGVGGGGSNAVKHMFEQGIQGVDFIICNTDAQALEISPVPIKIQLGATLTEGMGAGSIPEVGKNSAIETIDDVKAILEKNTKMLFITAGMGGGTGTGAAPVIAEVAKEMGILTVGIVTLPFAFEGRKRRLQAEEGIKELRKNVDTLLLICNDKLRELYGNLTLKEAFCKADNVLTTAAKGIAEIITVAGNINVDFKDVNTVMKNSGVAIMGSGVAEGENRAIKATEMALSSPLLNDNNIKGAKDMLLYIASGTVDEVTMDEISEITDYIQTEAGSTAEIIWGSGSDESLGSKISITLIATGFSTGNEPKKITHTLDETVTVKEKSKEYKVETEPTIELKFIDNTDNVTDDISLKDVKHTSEPKEKNIFEFDLKIPVEDKTTPVSRTSNDSDGMVLINKGKKEEKPVTSVNKPQETSKTLPDELNVNREQKAMDRIQRLKDLSLKLKTSGGLAELEREPAYVRRNVVLNEPAPSNETEVSRYTLSEGEDEEERGRIKQNNSFLHDNVD